MRHMFWLGIAFLPLSVLAQIPVVQESGRFQRVFLNEDGTPFELTGPSAIDGDIAIVGDPLNETFGKGVGAVHVFQRQPDGSDELWVRTQTLGPADPTPCEAFGAAVAVREDVVVAGTRRTIPLVGDPFVGCGRSPVPSGNRTRVFERQSAGWVQTLEVRDDVSGPYAIGGDLLVVGDQQFSTVYRRLAPGVWSGGVVLPVIGQGTPPGPDFPGVNASIAGNRVALASCGPSQDLEPSDCYHRANVYERDDQDTWALLADVISDQVGRVGQTSVSIAGGALGIDAQLYALDTYGPFPVSNLSIHTDSARANSTATLHANGAIVTVRSDVYRRGADGFWRPEARFRISDGRTPSSIGPYGGNRFIGAGGDGFFYIFELPIEIHAPTLSGLRVFPDVARAEDTVELTAAADNFGISSASIQKLEFRGVGTETWQAMTPLDGAYDGQFEAASAQIRIGDIASGGQIGQQPLKICVRATDADGNTVELLDTENELNNCPIVQIVSGDRSLDSLAPTVYEPSLYRTFVLAGQDNSIYVFADDTSSGGSGIQSVQYQIDDRQWRLMKPASPRFGIFSVGRFPVGVNAFAVLPPIGEVGVHSICVRAIDAAGNIGTHPCQSFEVVP